MIITSKCMSFTANKTDGTYCKKITKDNVPNYMLGKIPAIVPTNHFDWDNIGVYGEVLGKIPKGEFGIKPYSENRVVGDDSVSQYGWRLMTDGKNEPLNVMQPFIVTFFWKRVK